MKNKFILIASLSINIALIVLLILTFTTDLLKKSDNVESLDFSMNFYSTAETQNLFAQNLLLHQMKDIETEIELPGSRSLAIKKPKFPKECGPLKDKRKFKIELGELTLNIQKGQVANIKGLKITREVADTLLSNIFVFDKALSNICMILSGLGVPSTVEERIFILDLMGKQQKVVDSYTAFRLGISSSTNETDIKLNIMKSKDEINKIKEINNELS